MNNSKNDIFLVGNWDVVGVDFGGEVDILEVFLIITTMTQQYYTPTEARAHTKEFILQESETLRANLRALNNRNIAIDLVCSK